MAVSAADFVNSSNTMELARLRPGVCCEYHSTNLVSMRTICTLALLGWISSGQAQFIVECPAADTVACLEAIPAPDPSTVYATSDCDLDLDGNPIERDTTSTSGGGDGSGGEDGGAGDGADDGGSENGGTTASCETVEVDCYTASTVSVNVLDDGSTELSFEIVYQELQGCKHAISHVAFSLPDGVSALDFMSKDNYEGLLGNYTVENTTKNPYHSIKFETNHDNYEPGAREVFTFTIPAGVDYEAVNIRVKAAGKKSDVTLPIVCEESEGEEEGTEEDGEEGGSGEDDGGTSEPEDVNNVYVSWIYDYIVPGGSGCLDNPIVVERAFSVNDACGGSSVCVQEFLIASECVDGSPVGCTGDSLSTSETTMSRTAVETEKIWQPEAESYAASFSAAEEDETGYYSISITKRQDNFAGGVSYSDAEEIARLAPRGHSKYEFAHDAIGSSTDVQVEWVGQAQASPIRERPQARWATVFPNPGNSAFTYQFDRRPSAAATLTVADAFGRVIVREIVRPGADEVQLNAEAWPVGNFIIQVQHTDGAIERARWSKQR